MKPTLHIPNTLFQPKQLLTFMLVSLIVIGAMTLPGTVLAQDLGGTDTKVCGFFSNINSLLNMASIAVVTIAVVFAGYQIAFAHKRIADVAPILIGGLLIGAAGQIAKMLIGDSAQTCSATTSMVMHFLTTHYA
ncbi:type VI secretion protein [Dyella dinghuensis]|uniref:Type VI secretion protein n=2 Tax=Dyella dinghuensis TaxID=1920169 RepID=A0A3S0PE42_9GAMM|nr:TrbC/VirB2 family protein [Dyella dinghuensis]RUL66565.1 type VI secretion protein [Dyella dinghuensis]